MELPAESTWADEQWTHEEQEQGAFYRKWFEVALLSHLSSCWTVVHNYCHATTFHAIPSFGSLFSHWREHLPCWSKVHLWLPYVSAVNAMTPQDVSAARFLVLWINKIFLRLFNIVNFQIQACTCPYQMNVLDWARTQRNLSMKQLARIQSHPDSLFIEFN